MPASRGKRNGQGPRVLGAQARLQVLRWYSASYTAFPTGKAAGKGQTHSLAAGKLRDLCSTGCQVPAPPARGQCGGVVTCRHTRFRIQPPT